MTKVKELMVKTVFVVSEEETVLDAAKMMEKHDVGLLVVVEDMLTKHAVGVVSDRDIITKVVIKATDPAATSVKEIMTRDIISATPQEDLAKAIDKMKKNKVKRLPVIDDDALVGILSFSDVVKKFAEFKKKLVEFAIEF